MKLSNLIDYRYPPIFINGRIIVWRLGDHKEKIFVTQETVEKFRQLLISCEDCKDYSHIVWDSMIEANPLTISEDLVVLTKDQYESLINQAKPLQDINNT